MLPLISGPKASPSYLLVFNRFNKMDRNGKNINCLQFFCLLLAYRNFSLITCNKILFSHLMMSNWLEIDQMIVRLLN
jgi:hypothetical protein